MSTRLQYFAGGTFLFLFFLLVNLRSLIFWTLFPSTEIFTGEAWLEVQIWFLVLIVIGYLIWRQGLTSDLIESWKRQSVLLIFVLFCLSSIVWSVAWTTTLHRILVFLFATFTAAYIGTRYSRTGILRVLFWFSAIVLVTSLITVFVSPELGTDLNRPYNGAWRGIFWHKNHLGNLVPLFSIVFLFQALCWKSSTARFEAILAGILYIASFIVLYLTYSASGYIVSIILHMTFLGALWWLKYADRLMPRHYIVFSVVGVLVAVTILLNLENVLGLFNRNPTFTGRVPLWSYLLRDVFSASPWFGHGFGTIWADPSFRLQMRDILGWAYPVMLADNGFLDILLSLGGLGLILFLMVYLQGWIRSIHYFVVNRSLTAFFIPLFMVYTLFANLTYSLFMELEVLVWGIFIMLSFTMNKNIGEDRDGGQLL